jgi:hypothetical protein
MIDVSTTKLLAVLIDGDNFPADLAAALFAAITKLGAVAVCRVYGGSSGIAGWRGASAKHGIGLHEVMPGKNATDMKLAIEAMDIHHRGKLGVFCIVSSDSDFAVLARRLREDGVTVHGFGESKATAGFRLACNSFLTLDTPVPPKPVVQLGVAKSQKTPKSGVSAWPKLLAEALFGLPAGTEHLSLSALSEQIRKIDKTFSAKKYGGANFKELVVKSGLQLNKVEGHWVAVVPKALRPAA